MLSLAGLLAHRVRALDSPGCLPVKMTVAAEIVARGCATAYSCGYSSGFARLGTPNSPLILSRADQPPREIRNQRQNAKERTLNVRCQGGNSNPATSRRTAL